MATLNLAKIGGEGVSPRERHAKAYSQAMNEILSDIVKSINSADRLRNIFAWAFEQLKIDAEHIKDAVADVQAFADYFRVIRDCHKPYDYKDGKANPNEDLLIAEAERLLNVRDVVERQIGHLSVKYPDAYAFCRKLMKILFNYKEFCEGGSLRRNESTGEFSWGGSLTGDLAGWGAFAFLKELNVRYCPYCNAETVYAISVQKGGKSVNIRSALDHFIPHAEYPFLGISLYNLVPACYRCNSQIKEQRNACLLGCAHPYMHDLYAGYRFKVRTKDVLRLGYDETNPQFKLEIKKARNCESDQAKRLMVDFFDLGGVYNELYIPEAYDIIRRIRLFTPAYREMMRNSGLRRVSVSRALYGCDLVQSHITKFRLSKLTIDLKRQFEAGAKKGV